MSNSFNPTLCVTHNCNLDCVYCYQTHDCSHDMNIDVAFDCIDWIYNNIPEDDSEIELSFIGGEPLLKFELIKVVYDYVKEKYHKVPTKFFATTNGTVLNVEIKEWFRERRDDFVLGLSLDGTRESHNKNRSGSYDKIDFDFFLNTWPDQGVKMTISEYSIEYLADNIKWINELGFKRVDGVNLAEGDFDWDNEKYIYAYSRTKKIVQYYAHNVNITLDQTFAKPIEICELKKKEKKKWCGIGENMVFFDTDGKRYPCTFISPTTFSTDDIRNMQQIIYSDIDNFIDSHCVNNCYIYPVCSTCSGANHLVNKTFAERNKAKCKINKLMMLFVAEMHMNRINKHPELYEDETKLYYLIESIQNIRKNYLEEFKRYL